MIFFAIVFSVCLLMYLLYILWCSYHFAQIACIEEKEILPSVSIVVAARNESANIDACLASLFQQEYPEGKWEVIIVNDQSEDNTRYKAEQWQSKFSNLIVIDSVYQQNLKYKKAALMTGIRAANFEIILQTDADCVMGNQWMKQMLRHFDDKTNMVAGPVAVEAKPKVFEQLQSLEYMGLVALGAGGIQGKRPTMCNGANLAFKKKAFFKVGGYDGIACVASGDDELLMQKFFTNDPLSITFAKCKQAIVHTAAQVNWRDFSRQRIRWVSKSKAYLNKKTNLIQLISYLGFWSFPIWLGAIGWIDHALIFFLSLFILKSLIDLTIMIPAAKFFHKLRLLRYFLLLELVYIPYVLWIGLVGNFSQSYIWKNRSLR